MYIILYATALFIILPYFLFLLIKNKFDIQKSTETLCEEFSSSGKISNNEIDRIYNNRLKLLPLILISFIYVCVMNFINKIIALLTIIILIIYYMFNYKKIVRYAVNYLILHKKNN